MDTYYRGSPNRHQTRRQATKRGAVLSRLNWSRVVSTLSVALVLWLSPLEEAAVTASSSKPLQKPNILFLIMDDVGIDKMQIFGYGGVTPPQTPNIDAIAHAGVRFRNTWAMPECSPSRAAFFVGRYPLRTNIFAAIGSEDLANSQLSPFEATTPKLLKQHDYTSAMFGKFHLAGPDNNPAGNGTPFSLGWDFFYGYTGGLPAAVDTTAGGVAPLGTYSCGFVTGNAGGACYVADGSCTKLLPGAAPGRSCLESGGIFVQNQSCQPTPPSNLNFTTLNSYYVSPLVINDKNGAVEEISPADPRARVYRTTLEVNAARDWLKQQNSRKPWMATVSFSSAHTPYQQPPVALLPPGSDDGNNFDCTARGDQRTISNQMIEAMDSEIGRLLVEVGLATRTADGQLNYHPETTNTMVVVVTDNGSFPTDVKEPFDLNRAKGTSYQTGVWVPLIVAGPLVNSPNREVTHMVNVADLFELFGELGGVDVHKRVPKSHTLD
ncbi:MAG: sulfatase-like hydrolase/transferase, partial [Deltaproteobacteria bacterium]|nr:sulfatase-like hydrolase/transferase [Deltaproteobacteria bacterium]